MRADLDRKSTLLARHKDRLFQWQKLMKPEYTAELMAECQKREKSADAVVEIKPCIDAVMEDIKPPKTNGDPRSSETTIKQEVPDMDTGESDSNQKSSS